jgi:uncharacterized membrane protein YvbJ
MYCSNCGTEITEQSKFCPSCGKPLNDTVTETHVDEKQRVEVILLWSSIFVTLVAKKISSFIYAAILASCGVL